MAVRWNQMLWSGPLISTSGYLTNVHGLLAARAYPTRIAGCSWTIWADPEKNNMNKSCREEYLKRGARKTEIWLVNSPLSSPLGNTLRTCTSCRFSEVQRLLCAMVGLLLGVMKQGQSAHEAHSANGAKGLSSKLTDGSQIIPSLSHIKTWARKEVTRI